MAYPTLAKPANPRWDSTANPTLNVYAIMNEAAGAPVDLVSQETVGPYAPKLAQAWEGHSGLCQGLLPTWGTASFGDAGSQAILQWKIGNRAIRWKGRGLTSNSGSWTLFAVFRHQIPKRDRQFMYTPSQAALASHNIPFLSSNSNIQGCGIGLNVTEQGDVRLAEINVNGAFTTINPTTPIVLTAGNWYAVAITFTNASSNRIVNVYDYNAQSMMTEYSYTSSGSITFTTQNDLTIGNTTQTATRFSFSGDVAVVGCAPESWAAAVNSKFVSFYQNPYVWAAGTAYNSSSGTLAAGQCMVWGQGTSQIDISATRPSLGVWPVAVQLHRSTTPNFTPDGSTALAGKTGSFTSSASKPITWNDTAAVAGTTYFYKVVYTDNATATATSAESAGRRIRGSKRIGFMGSSNQAACNLPIMGFFSRAGWRAVVDTQLVPSSISSSGYNSWKPGAFSLRWAGTVGSAGNYFLNPWGTGATAAIPWNANAAAVKSALDALALPDVTWSVTGTSVSNTNEILILASGSGVPANWSNKTIVLTVDGSWTAGALLTIHSAYSNAVNWWLSQGITDVFMSVGFTESSDNATFLADLSAIVNDLVASGFTVWPAVDFMTDGSDVANGRLAGYIQQCLSLENGTTIRALGSPANDWVMGNPAEIATGLLPNTDDVWGVYAMAPHKILDPSFYNVTTVSGLFRAGFGGGF